MGWCASSWPVESAGLPSFSPRVIVQTDRAGPKRMRWSRTHHRSWRVPPRAVFGILTSFQVPSSPRCERSPTALAPPHPAAPTRDRRVDPAPHRPEHRSVDPHDPNDRHPHETDSRHDPSPPTPPEPLPVRNQTASGSHNAGRSLFYPFNRSCGMARILRNWCEVAEGITAIGTCADLC